MGYKWVPNAVSVLRGVLSIALFICALMYYWLATAIISTLAFATDGLDGWLAHWLDAKSDLGGKLIDSANDSLLSVALVAGLFFTGAIGWGVINLLAIITAAIWVPIILVGEGRLKARLTDWSRYWYVIVVIFFEAVYFYLAIGNYVGWLLLLAIPIGFWITCERSKRIRSSK